MCRLVDGRLVGQENVPVAAPLGHLVRRDEESREPAGHLEKRLHVGIRAFEKPVVGRSGPEAAALVERPLEVLGPAFGLSKACLLYTSPIPRDRTRSRMPSSA